MFAVIDLGSNSFHLLIADYVDGHFTVIDRHSERVQLAEKIFSTGVLQKKAMTRGLKCLQRFKKALSGYNVEKLSVVATQAMRQAGNAEEFRSKAARIGFDIDIISGPREAGLIYRGICDPLPDADYNRLIFDIGGASTEVALGNGQTITVAESTAIGCVSWRDQFFSEIFNYKKQAPAAKQAAADAIAHVNNKLQGHDWRETFASSGTAKMLSNVAVKNKLSDGAIRIEHLRKIEDMLLAYKRQEDIKISGLKKERRDLLAPGLCIMIAVMRTLGIDSWQYSHTALREGVLHEISSHRIDYHLHD